MTEPASASDVARLDELAAVTRDYARYSRRAFGFANVAVGAWIALVAVFGSRFPEWGNVLLAFAPLMWLELLPLSRARYQRMGEVVEREIEGVRMGHLIFVFCFALLAAARVMTKLLRWASAGGPFAWFGLAAAVAALVLVGPRARRRTRGSGDSMMAFLLLMTVTGAIADGHRDPAFWRLMLLAYAGFLLVAGTHQHLAHHRLERRLAALKEAGR